MTTEYTNNAFSHYIKAPETKGFVKGLGTV